MSPIGAEFSPDGGRRKVRDIESIIRMWYAVILPALKMEGTMCKD